MVAFFAPISDILTREMETDIELKDDKGETIVRLVQFQDITIPRIRVNTYPGKSIQQKLKERESILCNDGDVLLCSYLKSGAHWINNLVKLLQFDGPVEDSPSFVPMFMEFFPIEQYLLQPSPRVIHSHLKLDRAPMSYLKQGKIILVVRNPKDAAVSCFQFLKWVPIYNINGKWDYFIRNYVKVPLFVGGTYPEYLKSMQEAIHDNKDLDIHVVYYENLIKNGMRELRKLQHHLGYNHSDERLQSILDRCSLKRLGDDVDEGKTGALFKSSSGKQVLYRKGKIGDWKNHLTVAQSEAFDAEWEALMKDSMFHFQYT